MISRLKGKKIDNQNTTHFLLASTKKQIEMELVCGNYDVKLIPNPTDFILRLENRENARLFERTFFERDFAEYIVLGGLEFVINLLKDVMPKQAGIKESPTQATFTVSWTPQFTRRIEFNFVIPAIKRDKASGDMEEVTARMKKMEKATAEQMAALDRIMVLYNTLNSHVSELEARCGDTITLPGCDYAIPTDVQNLILIQDGGMLPDGKVFSSLYQGHFGVFNHAWNHQYGIPNFKQNEPFFRGDSQPTRLNWECYNDKLSKSFVFYALRSIKNLKYCKNLRQLTICGSSHLTNYNLSENINLTHLTIVANFQNQDRGNNQNEVRLKDSHPPLTDISWISNLKNLQNVSFRGGNQLVNVGPIKDLPNLKELDLRDTGVKNTGFLASSTLKITV